MATIEQMRERQDEIVHRFQTQPMPRGQLTEATQRAVASALREPRAAKPRKRAQGKGVLPPPSREAQDFIVRALGNPQFRALMERLAGE